MKQVLLTPAAGKLLISKALTKHPTIQSALKTGTLVIVAGTTNGYIAKEILQTLGVNDFSAKRFFRGITLPPKHALTAEGRLNDETQFPGDVVISKGVWQKGKTLADVVDSLKAGDCIVKGANALDLSRRKAAVLVGHPKAGTAGLAVSAVFGRRVKLIVAVGLEKRVVGDLDALAQRLSCSDAAGYRLMPLLGEVFTELEAIKALSGATAELIAAGGVCGAEGSCWLMISGSKAQEEAAQKIIDLVADAAPFELE